MDDIAPGLLEKIRQSFLKNIEKNKNAAALLKQIESGTATYAQAGDYAYEIGAALSDAFSENLSSAVLPDGRMYQNIAEKVIAPMLGEDHTVVSKAAARVQQSLNEAAGIGLKAQTADLDSEKVQGIVRKVSSVQSFDDAAWVLGEPVKTFSQSVVDNTLKKNAEFQSKSGLRPRIIRRAESKCCEWCSKMDGVYDYPGNVPDDVYRRHERCRCLVEFDSSSGKRQNVWSKQYGAAADQQYTKGDVAKERKEIAQSNKQSFSDNIVNHPGRLKSADPDALREKLRDQKIRTFDLKDGGYSADLGDGKKLIYDGKGGYSLTSDGKNVWTGSMNGGNIEARKVTGIKSITEDISEHPMKLASYTPETLKTDLETNGYEVKPLKQGSLKNVPFENGGGYKVNFEDGGLLQYHPEAHSHHDGAYYKISTGKGGTHRYDINGIEQTKRGLKKGD